VPELINEVLFFPFRQAHYSMTRSGRSTDISCRKACFEKPDLAVDFIDRYPFPADLLKVFFC